MEAISFAAFCLSACLTKWIARSATEAVNTYYLYIYTSFFFISTWLCTVRDLSADVVALPNSGFVLG
jgi:hypothetical protein